MKTKIIPFCLETAKKIQSGEIKGRIINTIGTLVEIISFNVTNTPTSIVGIVHYPQGDSVIYIRKDGSCFNSTHDIILELPEAAPKHEFKPFEKVLVKPYDISESMEDVNCWRVDVFSHIDKYTGDCVCIGGLANPKYTLPYEGNEHLVGTTDNPKEE